MIEENEKRAREIEYLRLEMSRSFREERGEWSGGDVLGELEGSFAESLRVVGNGGGGARMKRRVGKRTTEGPIVSPLEMSLVKENLVIEESKTFCFGD